MILKHLYEGGPLFMAVIYAMWLAVIVLTAINIATFSKDEKFRAIKRRNELILFLGSLAFLIGILGQTLGIFSALGAIQVAKEISPPLIFAGIRVSMLAPAYGFVLLIISSIIWFVFKNYILTKHS